MTKNDILNQVTPEEIFLFFLTLSEFPKSTISSPFTEDKTPSFKLYKNGTFKCHSSGKQGDVFQFVADLNNIDSKSQFNEVLGIITNRLSLVVDNKKLTYETRKLDQKALEFWNTGNWNVSQPILDKYGVKALSSFTFYNSKKEDDTTIDCRELNAFVYKVNNRVEIYVPKQPRFAKKFVINKNSSSDIFGFSQLDENNEVVVITAGKKDCLILNANGIPAVCFRSENHKPTKKQIDSLKNKCDFLFICYDNDLPGQNSMAKIIEEFDVIKLPLDKNFNDIAKYFERNSAEKIKNSLNQLVKVEKDKVSSKNNDNIFHKAENFLNQRYNFRFNTILLDIEICKKGYDDWEIVNENNLYLQLQKSNIKISINNLVAILRSDEFVKKYNPIKEYFESLSKWSGKTDYIAELGNYVSAIDQEQFIYHFKKWAVRVVKCALLKGYFNKQAFVLVQRGQNTGKSTFCRFLAPTILQNYIAIIIH